VRQLGRRTQDAAHAFGVFDGFSKFGYLGVDVFFVISGFVIPYSLWGREYSLRQFPRYMIRRAVRLEPPYLASVVFPQSCKWLPHTRPPIEARRRIFQ
jgi:peptidoglycan/LPS O-acetylase OafA/YrhL